jgi:hypothetical protein
MEVQYTKEKVVQWFAGFYEGEGWVSNDITNMNRLRLGIAQNDPKPLEIAMSIWGGRMRKRTRKSPASDKICIGYELILDHKRALEFLDDIKPFMLIPYKIQQVKAVIDKSNEPWTSRFACKLCKKEYANPAARRRHVRNFHENSNASEKSVTLNSQENQTAGTS